MISTRNLRILFLIFDIKKDMFTSHVVFIAKSISCKVSVALTSPTNQPEITPETGAVINVPQPLLLNKTETVYS